MQSTYIETRNEIRNSMRDWERSVFTVSSIVTASAFFSMAGNL